LRVTLTEHKRGNLPHDQDQREIRNGEPPKLSFETRDQRFILVGEVKVQSPQSLLPADLACDPKD